MGFSYGPLVGIKKNPKQLKRVFVYYAKKRVIKGYKIHHHSSCASFDGGGITTSPDATMVQSPISLLVGTPLL